MDEFDWLVFLFAQVAKLGIFAVLAIHFEKWWIVLFALLFMNSLQVHIPEKDDEEVR